MLLLSYTSSPRTLVSQYNTRNCSGLTVFKSIAVSARMIGITLSIDADMSAPSTNSPTCSLMPLGIYTCAIVLRRGRRHVDMSFPEHVVCKKSRNTSRQLTWGIALSVNILSRPPPNLPASMVPWRIASSTSAVNSLVSSGVSSLAPSQSCSSILPASDMSLPPSCSFCSILNTSPADMSRNLGSYNPPLGITTNGL